MAKRIQNFRNFNSEREEKTSAVKKAEVIVKPKKIVSTAPKKVINNKHKEKRSYNKNERR